MAAERSRRVRIACWMSLGTLAALWVPAACIFPQYTFDEEEAAGGGTSASGSTGGAGTTSNTTGSASVTSGSTGGASTSSSSAGGGMSTTSASSSASASSGSGGSGSGAGGTGQGGGTASSSASASSASSGSASSGSGGSGTGELCLNNVDDDGDGDTDCADSECMPGHVCVNNVPAGWSGFFALFEGLPSQEPQCPSAFPSNMPYTAHHTLFANSAMCSACTCGTPMGQACDLPDTFTLRNKPCGQTATYTGSFGVPASWTGSCYGSNYFPGGVTTCDGPCNVSLTSPAATATGGSCASQGGTPTLPPVTWGALGKACGDSPSGIGCGAGMVCQPKPGFPFYSGLCISKPGDNACPGAFTQKHLFYEGFMDTRGCSACACGTPSGSTCSATITAYSDPFSNVCATAITSFPTGGCGDIAGNPRVQGRTATNITISGGSCPATGGVPTGAATATSPNTFCCVP